MQRKQKIKNFDWAGRDTKKRPTQVFFFSEEVKLKVNPIRTPLPQSKDSRDKIFAPEKNLFFFFGFQKSLPWGRGETPWKYESWVKLFSRVVFFLCRVLYPSVSFCCQVLSFCVNSIVDCILACSLLLPLLAWASCWLFCWRPCRISLRSCTVNTRTRRGGTAAS